MDWMVFLLILLGLVSVVTSGLAVKFWKEGKEFFVVTRDAFRDGKLDDAEIAQIIKEAKDVNDVALGIAKLFKR